MKLFPNNLEAIAFVETIERLTASGKCSVGIHIVPRDPKNDFSKDSITVRLMTGSYLKQTSEFGGASETSLSEALERALDQAKESTRFLEGIEPVGRPERELAPSFPHEENFPYDEENCPGHVASIGDNRVCANCGANAEDFNVFEDMK